MPRGAERLVAGLVALAAAPEARRPSQAAVDLVGRGEDERRRRRPGRGSASSTLSVPRALTSKSWTGSTRLVVTATWAAKWNTVRRPGHRLGARRRRRARRRSRSRRGRRGVSRSHAQVLLDAGAREVVEQHARGWPAASSRWARLVPMKPAPPVIRTVVSPLRVGFIPSAPGEASSARASATRSSATCPSSQAASSTQSLLEGHRRLVAEDAPGERDVGEAVADVADAVACR